jgi:predicted TIM-barrel fold metal-dependent hydrolase
MFQQWRNSMRHLAELPNVCVKISGFGMTVRISLRSGRNTAGFANAGTGLATVV